MRYFWIKSRIPVQYRETENIDLTPIFIVGTNRSGTSIVSSFFSQHPNLEGIFSGHLKPTFDDTTKHANGYCESEHIWPWLREPTLPFFSVDKIPDAVLWGHPKYISKAYRDKPKNKKEVLLMANAISQYRITDKHPLIKDQWNLFRIGLIKKAIPHAKFVLVIRDYKDYFNSCNHKWFASKGINEHISIAAHWLTANIIAYSDLQEYALNDHVIINYNQLIKNHDKAKHILGKACAKLELKDYKFDLGIIDKRLRYNKHFESSTPLNFSKISIDDILMEYRKVTEGLKNQSND